MLFVSPAAELGGSERSLLDCVFALRETDPTGEVRMLAFADGPLVRRARSLGALVQVLVPPRALTEFGESARGSAGFGALFGRASATPECARFLVKLRQSIVLARPEIVHTNGMKAHVLASLVAPARIRVVVHLRDFIGSRRMSKWVLPTLARLRPRIAFIANSHAVAEDFAHLASRAEIKVVYNVVDTELFSPGPAQPEWLATCAGLAPPPPDAVVFGLVATYARWKGHDLFIEAAGRLRAANPNVPLRFYVVGGPIYQTLGSQVSASELKESARAAGIGDCFGLVPFQEEIVRVYRSLNVAVHASTQPEPFGRTIVEAMASGRPVIVANAGGASELFQQGENALGFEPCNAQALAEAMAHTLDSHTRDRLSRSARVHSKAAFGRARLGPELLGVYGLRSAAEPS